jgi:phosphatidylserine/phosphatidylglycerophosphate/cardiolipin synthase-like enzyme
MEAATLERWFLTLAERGNPDSGIEHAYTVGNTVNILIDGEPYYRRLLDLLQSLQPGDHVWFTDWRGDPDERLDGPGTESGVVLAGLARRGVDVRGLLWRSHSDRLHFSERENRDLSAMINEAGGEALLDERVRRAGSHHQKIVVVQSAGRANVVFVGGIDLSHGRRDDHCHRGDDQPVELDHRYGPRPAWHDVQLEIEGPATRDIIATFRERWEDPTPLDHRVPWRIALRKIAREPRRPCPLPATARGAEPAGHHAVQVLRTYPAKRPAFPFARRGERSVARAYLKAFAQANALIYIEDQYLWSPEAASALTQALRRSPRLRVVAVVPAFPDRDGRFSGPPYRIGQQDAIAQIKDAGADRVAIYDLESDRGFPIYVHAKVCIVDDVWMTVGSDNLNRRSWTNDSEASCALIDAHRDGRQPLDPGGDGDGARALARDTRLRLWREHLSVTADEGLIDPITGFDRLAAAAHALDAWHAGGCVGPRPTGRLRTHVAEPVARIHRGWARVCYKTFVDPDGRPRAFRRRNAL